MLLCERNTIETERKIRSAFRQYSHKIYFDTFFEHGQWWVRLSPEYGDDQDMTYSVCDANTQSGFDFEKIG